MNLDNDYDEDGNNIVPCPICLSNYCPSKVDGKCPDEDEFARDMKLKEALGEQWQNVFLSAGTENGLGDLSMMIGVVSKILTTYHEAHKKEAVEDFIESMLADMNKNTPLALKELNDAFADGVRSYLNKYFTGLQQDKNIDV